MTSKKIKNGDVMYSGIEGDKIVLIRFHQDFWVFEIQDGNKTSVSLFRKNEIDHPNGENMWREIERKHPNIKWC